MKIVGKGGFEGVIASEDSDIIFDAERNYRRGVRKSNFLAESFATSVSQITVLFIICDDYGTRFYL